MDKAEFYREARDDLAGPLDGTRVLDVTTVWSGPMASCVLADFGCEVIRVEMPHSRATQLPPAIPGTRLSWFHQTVNRNKLSVGLDLRVRESAELFLELVRTADILIENFRPGTMDRWGVGFERCRAVKADLVYVSISGWGQFGPKAARGGCDPTIQVGHGWVSLNSGGH